MVLDLYSPCPCGSGKKFKWCCQPIHTELGKAFRLDEEGQHEMAVRTMDEVVQQHPTNPEAWGRRAQLLYQNDRVDDAESSLDKAFEVSPNYAFGYLLRGTFRQHEGEIPGALSLFRRAAEHYDPEAKDILSQVYGLIADCEMRLNRPVAARAALKISLHCRPDEQAQKNFDTVFNKDARLPASARKEYAFQRPSRNSPPQRLAAWERTLGNIGSGKLVDVHRAFEQLCTAHPEDASAWYNLALARSWLGDNTRAIEALEHYVNLQPDENLAAGAWALAEVLRHGHGMEDEADFVEHSVLFPLKDPESILKLLQQLEAEKRLRGVNFQEEEHTVTGIITDKVVALTPESAAAQAPILGAYFFLGGGLFRLWNTNQEAFERVRREMQERAGLTEGHSHRGQARFGDSWMEALVFPTAESEEEHHQRVRGHVQDYFEEKWIHRPLKSLRGVSPVDAAGHRDLRKKLLGVIQFLEECAPGDPQPYDFDRLRRKLGLIAGAAPAADSSVATTPDITAMGVSELAALQSGGLSEEQVESAYQTAKKLDAHDLAVNFARNLVTRPIAPGRTDRFPIYLYLMQRAQVEGDMDRALQYVDEGEKSDCECNEGRRRNDYELNRGKILVKRGEADHAGDVFQRLIDRMPSELKYRSTAAEAMLSAKRGDMALRFAEQGLQKAREKNDRDSEGHFLELVSAAKRQTA